MQAFKSSLSLYICASHILLMKIARTNDRLEQSVRIILFRTEAPHVFL